MAPADALGDVAVVADTGATVDTSTAVANLPPGPVLELRANQDYMGGALAVIQTAAGKPCWRKKAATVPPPIPWGLASRP